MYSYRDMYPNMSMWPSVREMTVPEGNEQVFYTQENISPAPAIGGVNFTNILIALAVIVGLIFILHM